MIHDKGTSEILLSKTLKNFLYYKRNFRINSAKIYPDKKMNPLSAWIFMLIFLLSEKNYCNLKSFDYSKICTLKK